MNPYLRKTEKRIGGLIHRLGRWNGLRKNVICLLYHLVSDEELDHVRHIYPYKTANMFENDLRYLERHFNLITYAELARAIELGHALPPSSATLMFDDTYAEQFSVIRPALLRHGIPATFFITTDFVDNRKMFYRNAISLLMARIGSREPDARKRAAFIKKLQSLSGLETESMDAACRDLGVDIEKYLDEQKPYMTTEEIRRMVTDGFTLGAHGVTHIRFDQLSEEALRAEILDSCRFVQEMTGEEQVPLALPFDTKGVDRDFLRRLRKDNPLIGLMFGTSGLQKDEPFIVHRIEVGLRTDAPAHRSDIPELIGRAYARAKVKALIRKFGG